MSARRLPILLAMVLLGCAPHPSTLERDDRPAVRAPMQGPGLGNLAYSAGEVFTRIGAIVDADSASGGHGNVVMVNGYLATIYTRDGGGSNASFAFWDVSDPRAPVRVANHVHPAGSKLREAHGFGLTSGYGGKTTLAAQSTTGFQLWDWSDVNAPALVADVVLPGVTDGDYTGVWWVALQAPYVFVAGGAAGLFVVDVTDPRRPLIVDHQPSAALGLPRVNQIHVIGNLAIANYTEDGSGVALLDVSDPERPAVRYTTRSLLPTPYSTAFNGGKLASAGKKSEKLSVFEVTFNGNDDPDGLVPYGVETGKGLAGGGYLTFQDGFVHAGFSNKYAKFDLRALPITQVGVANPGSPYNGDVDFGVALGNLVFLGNDHGHGSGLVVHQAEPDRTGPSVNFVSPRDGAVRRDVRSRVGLTFTDAVDLRSLGRTTIIVRPVGGVALSGKYSTQQNGIVNFSPDARLQPGTTYEVVVPAGGVQDYAGNGVPRTFVSRFSTGAAIEAAPLAGCELGVDAPGLVDAPVVLAATGCSGGGPLAYSWNPGDGSPASPFSTSPRLAHAYGAARHYLPILTVKDGAGRVATFSRTQTIIHPATARSPSRSSTIVHDAARGRVSVVNSDAGTVASISSSYPYARQWETPVGRGPRTLALTAPGGDLWVVDRDSDDVRILDGGSGAPLGTVALPRASRPYGIAIDPAGTTAYVTLEATGRLLRLDVASRVITGAVDVGPRPRGLAISGDGARILVTRLISPAAGGEVREISAPALAVARTFQLPYDATTPSSESDGPGLPNYLQAVTITPDGRSAWVPSKKDNLGRGTGPTSDGVPLTFESRVRTMVSVLDLAAGSSESKDINNSDLALAVAFDELGDHAFVVTQGNNHVEVYDALDRSSIASIDETGRAPRGLVVAGRLLFVHDFLSRDVAIFDVGAAGGSNVFPRVATVVTQAIEPLAPEVLAGKKVFHDAADARMSRDGYLSCASCHDDGEEDGQVWDGTQDGEGRRNTISLLGNGGSGRQGPFHWTGNFDEVQDFEIPIRDAFGGTGFMSDADFAAARAPLGPPKAGRSAELDALAAYVRSLTAVPPSPYRNPDGSLTADALAGRALFESPSVGCAGCHSGPALTDSALGVRHDVGTLGAASGRRLGQPLDGLDTPSLLGVWATPPYLHDGSAATLLDVITTRNPDDRHGVTSGLGPAELRQLVAYLLALDDSDMAKP